LFEFGIDNYLAKPFELQHLHQIINYGIGRHPLGNESVLPMPVDVPNPIPPQDFDPVVGIKMVGGDEEMFRELLADFVSQLPDKVVTAERHLEHHDIMGLSRVAHTIKGVSLNLGALQLYEYASRLEYYSGESYTSKEDLKKDIQALKAKSLKFIQKASDYLAGE
jgi:HPt (histidine-containing phosphotransfer) domain-containing protein